MKTIYFVRHGEGEINVQEILSREDLPLTERGRGQAQAVADRFRNIDVDAVVASTLKRAHETGQIIAETISKPLINSELFVERRRPTEQFGKIKRGPEVKSIDETMVNNYHLDGHRYSDEENFDDLKQRALKALQFLADRPEDNIVVATHGFFMMMILATVLFGEKLTSPVAQQFVRKCFMENTGITVIKYDPAESVDYDPEKPVDQRWWLWIWNDHSHLD